MWRRAHARSGDPVAIAAYVGGGDVFDRAISRRGIQKHKEEIRAKLEELKAKLHLNKKAAATTA